MDRGDVSTAWKLGRLWNESLGAKTKSYRGGTTHFTYCTSHAETLDRSWRAERGKDSGVYRGSS